MIFVIYKPTYQLSDNTNVIELLTKNQDKIDLLKEKYIDNFDEIDEWYICKNPNSNAIELLKDKYIDEYNNIEIYENRIDKK